MLAEEDRERICRAYYVDHHSLRQIARETGHSFRTIVQALDRALPFPSAPPRPRAAPVFGPFHARVEQLLAENEHLPHKQRYTARRIFQVLREKGYAGCESPVRQFVADWRHARRSQCQASRLRAESGHQAGYRRHKEEHSFLIVPRAVEVVPAATWCGQQGQAGIGNAP
jgi:hypothetical protein